jgi:hypothetical protein
MTTVITLFLFGLAVDLLWCLSVQSSARMQAGRATIYTVFLTGIQLAANWQIIANNSIPGFVAFICGCALGTYLASTPRLRRGGK